MESAPMPGNGDVQSVIYRQPQKEVRGVVLGLKLETCLVATYVVFFNIYFVFKFSAEDNKPLYNALYVQK